MSEITSTFSSPVVTLSGNHAVTMSIDVAAFFGKLHKNVLLFFQAPGFNSYPPSAKAGNA